jgi:GGDEF domain-containing protein
VARYGGEAFVVLMGVSIEDAIEVAERVRHGVEHESVTENVIPLGSSVTVSVGVAALTEDVSSLEQLELSEKTRTCLQRASAYWSNPCSERCQYPFSDRFLTEFSEVRVPRICRWGRSPK